MQVIRSKHFSTSAYLGSFLYFFGLYTWFASIQEYGIVNGEWFVKMDTMWNTPVLLSFLIIASAWQLKPRKK